ncbi:hypothetical protein [Candidatus Thiodictyon syntrophicum]|uniref:Uncharacterized protein n=1 Tax=Candidatus Thiodictyon syntrophicum TaxID=1166950 RepID=A0A2K8U3H4_9GAMM|nr:hypothetical protein [Candidatus Thiodictyon syntrophicum]AUB80130.1 hypothetical protein THSYN_03575 [Candidatus Thiodictyon syntrophicum]
MIFTSEPDAIVNNHDLQKKELADSIGRNIVPFYEHWLARSRLPPLVFSVLLGLIFLLIHSFLAFQYQINIFRDFSYLLAIMMMLCMFLIFRATDKLKEFVVDLIDLSGLGEREYADIFVLKLSEIAGYKLLFFGVCVGLLNVLMGIAFGIWYRHPVMIISLCLQFFMIGLLCGMALRGLLVVIKLVWSLQHDRRIDINYMHPDDCGGTLIVGKVLFVFSMHTLIMGLFIAFYIYVTPWEYRATSRIAAWFMNIWMLTPFVASLMVFVLPVLRLHQLLDHYKRREHRIIRLKMEDISRQIAQIDPAASQRISFLNAILEHLKFQDDYIARMNAWPYNSRYSVSYLIAFASPLLVAIISKHV